MPDCVSGSQDTLMNKNVKNFLKQLNILVLWWQKIVYYYLLVPIFTLSSQEYYNLHNIRNFLTPFSPQNADIIPSIQMFSFFTTIFLSLFHPLFSFSFISFLTFYHSFSKYVCIQLYIVKLIALLKFHIYFNYSILSFMHLRILYFNT